MITRLFFSLSCPLLFVFITTATEAQPDTARLPGNHRPVVKIISPGNGSQHPANNRVRYLVDVSDAEDGESKYDEIPHDRIFLEVRYIRGDAERIKSATDSFVAEPVGLMYIKSSGCFACHRFKSTFIGPSFHQIAGRYAQKSEVAPMLAKTIRTGSEGVWGQAVMPAHPTISQEVAEEIVKWILDKGGDTTADYLTGKEGTFRTDLPGGTGEGSFVLKATYTDNGVSGKANDRLTGEDVIVIHVK